MGRRDIRCGGSFVVLEPGAHERGRMLLFSKGTGCLIEGSSGRPRSVRVASQRVNLHYLTSVVISLS